MKTSAAGLNLIKHFEGCLKPAGAGKFKPYICPAGVLTIGWGHTNHHGRKFTSSDVWTQAECDAELVSDLRGFEAAVSRLVKVPVTQRQFDALVSFVYNCGEGNLTKSTLLRKVNAKDFAGAAQEFHKWNKGGGKVLPGLVRRRAAESLLFQGLPDDNYDGKPDGGVKPMPDLMPQHVDVPAEPKSDTGKKAAGSVGAGTAAAVVAQQSGFPLTAVAAVGIGVTLAVFLILHFKKG